MFKSLPSLPTLKSLPQAIGLPFLSTHEDAQVAFRAGDNGIKRLYGNEVIPLSEESYWSQYWTLFNSAADVHSLITAQDVRQTLTSSPTNLSNLLTSLSHRLFTLLPSAAFPSQAARDALNCLRVLGRVLVVVYEAEADACDAGVPPEATWAAEYLWKRVPVDGAGERTDEPQFTLEDSDDEPEDEGARAFKATIGAEATTPEPSGEMRDPLANPEPQAPTTEQEFMPCLADRLFSCTIDLLFCAGFTVPDAVRGADGLGDKINYVIWEKGVGSTVNIGSAPELDRNKVEVLRFLLILLSSTIYTLPHALATTRNVPLARLTHALERRLVLSLLCSLLNTSLASPKAGAVGAVPYNHLVFKASDERRELVRTCLMVLLVALDGVGTESAAEVDGNAFRYFVSKLHRKDDFAFVLGGILGILEEQISVTNNYLPGAKKPVPYILETFMLLWRLVDLNKRFRSYLFESGKAIDVIGYVLICCLEFKDDPAHHGLLRMLSYLLQTLSADPAFAAALNQPLRQAVPAKWAVQGSAADFMIVSIYSIATTPGLNPLFPALTISIANVAPQIRHVGVQASTRLLQLFKAFSSPNFLLADEGHPRLVYYLLETFNSVLYHQLNGEQIALARLMAENPNLVYAILRSHQDFQTLATFTLLSGLRDIQRRKARASERDTATPRGLVRSDSELAMLAEKAALLGRDDDDDERPMSPRASAVPTPGSPGADVSTQPLTTPGDDAVDPIASPASPTAGLSEKARGKMRAVEPAPEADETDDELMRLAAAGVGPNGYVPTQEWVSSWQKGLPLDPVLVAISELLPKIQDSQPPRAGGPSSKVLNLLKGADLGAVLPPGPPAAPRRFQWSPQSRVWLTSLLWGDIYVAGLLSTGVWRDTTVKLFSVKQAPTRARNGQVGRVLKMMGVV
ncbi:hypothetical protein Q5752_003291 [Cryptotrichosporon argae]